MVEKVNMTEVNAKKQQAWELFNGGQTEAANRIATELYESGSANAELTYLIGCCLASLNFYDKAMVFFKESLTYQDSQTNLPYIYIALGASANALNQHDKAISYYEQALSINPNLADVYLGIGEVYIEKDDINRAEENFIKAKTLVPDSGMPYYRLGHVEKKRANGAGAIKFFQKAIDREPTVADYQIWLADTLLKMEFIEEAKSVSARALNLSPLSTIALGTQSAACARLGDYEEAIKNINAALKENFLIADVATAFLTVCKHVDRCDEAIKYAERCLSHEGISETASKNLHAQLALTLDHCKRYDEAWHHITECKKYKYDLVDDYDSVVFKVAIDNIISTFTPANLLGIPSSTVQHDYAPIFILGMPRSGTSLVEQILAAHSDVTACGELPIINDLIKKIPTILNSEKIWPYCLTYMTQDHMDTLSNEYIKLLPVEKQQATFITDKMPHNFLALGLIQLLFPKAKVIHCRRQPLDTSISIYFANFHSGHKYSGNLFNIGSHYFQYLRLMEHWRSYLSMDLLEMDYELLVTEPEIQIRKLLSYCELGWEESCLHFNKLDRKVKTASYDQVRQPIYTKSIDRWKNYEKYLDNLKSGLERGC